MNTSQVWHEFLRELQNGPMPAARIRPYHPETSQPLLTNLNGPMHSPLLDTLVKGIQPECCIAGNQQHYILPLGEDGVNFCFSFLVEQDQWYFQHMENIFIRLDQAANPPVSVFPDLPEDNKAWARDEIRIFEDVCLYRFFSEDKGKTFALDWFRDGEGYFLGARARLRYFDLYQRSSNIPQMISQAEYYELFETKWKDRAAFAGWNLCIAYEAGECIFTFTKAAPVC